MAAIWACLMEVADIGMGATFLLLVLEEELFRLNGRWSGRVKSGLMWSGWRFQEGVWAGNMLLLLEMENNRNGWILILWEGFRSESRTSNTVCKTSHLWGANLHMPPYRGYFTTIFHSILDRRFLCCSVECSFGVFGRSNRGSDGKRRVRMYWYLYAYNLFATCVENSLTIFRPGGPPTKFASLFRPLSTSISCTTTSW